MLEVEAQLTDVRGQIEVLTAELVQLSNRADLATLAVTFRVPVVATVAAQQGWDPATQVDQATASLVEILQALAGAGIWFLIVWLPILVVLGILGGIVLWFLRRVGLLRRPTSTPPAPPAAPGGPATPATRDHPGRGERSRRLTPRHPGRMAPCARDDRTGRAIRPHRRRL